MPFVNNNVRIHYEVVGSGSPLLLLHGFSDSLDTWQEYGYVEELSKCFQVVLVDSRGHGKSDKPLDPVAYRMPKFASDVLAVLDELQLRVVHFFGYSFGARVGFALAKEAPARISSLLLGGSPPIGPGKPDSFDADPWVPVLQSGAKAITSLWDAPVSAALRAYRSTHLPGPWLCARQERGRSRVFSVVRSRQSCCRDGHRACG